MPGVAVIQDVVRRHTRLFMDPFARRNVCCDSSWLCLQLAEKVNGHSDPRKECPVPLGQRLEVSSCRCMECHLFSLCAARWGPQGPCQPGSKCVTLLSSSCSTSESRDSLLDSLAACWEILWCQ